MTKQEFIQQLGAQLGVIPEQERQWVLDFYGEIIEDRIESGENEQDAVARMGNVADLAAQVLQEYPGRVPERSEQPAQTMPPPQDGGWTYHPDGRRCYTAPAAGLTRIVVDTRNMEVEFRPCDGDQIQIYYYEDDNRTVTITGEPVELRFTCRFQNNWLSWIFDWHMFRKQIVTVLVPSSFGGELYGETSNAKIKAGGIGNLQSLWCKTSNAGIDVSFIGANAVTAQTSNGRTVLTDLHVNGDVFAKNSNAALEIFRVTAGSVTGRTSNAHIRYEQVSARGSVGGKTSNGKVQMSDVRSGGILDAQSNNGAIRMDRAAAPAIQLHTSNAAITGTIQGRETDYTIRGGTSNGYSSLIQREGIAGKTLEARTSNARLDLAFLER